jgi:hypothetical protein
MKPNRVRVYIGSGVMALALSTSAVAATHCRPCHPDPFGTRLLSVPGTVRGYVFKGDTVRVDYAPSAACSSSYVWTTRTAPLQTFAAKSCSRAASSPLLPTAARSESLAAVDGNRILRVVAPAGVADRPARIEVRRRLTNQLLRSWPLPAVPVSLDVAGGLAVFSAAGGGGLFAVRLSDGRAGFVGVNRNGDVPQIEPSGVVYADDIYRHSPNHNRAFTLLKFVPIAGVRHAIDVAGTPIFTPGPIRALAMDGVRVALAVADPRGVCDQIRFWNIPWNFTSRLTQESGPTCTGRHAPGGITDVRIAGARAEWVTTYGGVSTVLAASIIRCQEWVLARPRAGAGGDQLAGLAGNGRVLSFAVARHERELRGLASVAALRPGSESRTQTVLAGRFVPRALVADGSRLAVLRDDGAVEIDRLDGTLEQRIDVGNVRAIALRANRLVALTNRVLYVFDAKTGKLLRGWRAPIGLRPRVDVQFGVAALTDGHVVYALDLETGRIAALARTATPLTGVEIEAPGIAYAYNSGGVGRGLFIRFADIEAALR